MCVISCPFWCCGHLDGGGGGLVALLGLSSWCRVVFGWLFLKVPWGCLQFVIVVFPDHTHLLLQNFNDESTSYLKIKYMGNDLIIRA